MRNALAFGLAALTMASTWLGPVRAEEVYQNTNVSIGYTSQAKLDPVFGTGTADKKLWNLRLEHYGVHGFGDNYFFAEIFNGRNVGDIPFLSGLGLNSGSFAASTKEHYLIVWVPRFSLSALTGGSPGKGLIKDWYLAGRIERSDYANFRSENVGISVDLNIPGFAFFETDLYARQDSFVGDTRNGLNPFWRTFAIVPFQVGGQQFKWTPLALVNFRRDDRDTEIFIQPDLWWVLNKSVELGLRIEHHRYSKTAAEGGGTYTRTSPTVLARWNF